jgi:hypothetical protein
LSGCRANAAESYNLLQARTRHGTWATGEKDGEVEVGLVGTQEVWRRGIEGAIDRERERLK